MKSDKSDFTQGSILAKLSFFMLPILGALVLQAAYGAVDLLVVGRFGSTSGLSAVSTGSQVLNLVTFVVTQLAMGVTVLIARYLGEKKPQHIGQVIGGAAVVFTLLAALLFVILVFFARPISGLMQAPAEALDSTARYVGICGGGILFIVAYNMLSAIFRGLGDSKSPLIFVLVACIVNIVGDLVLVAGFHLDAAGAAIATVAAQAVSVVCAVVMLAKKKLPFQLRREDFRLNDVCLMFPCILFQARFHVLFIQLVEVLKQHIKVTVCLKQKSSLPVLCFTFGNEATLALLFSLPLPVLITNHSIPSAVFILIYGHYSSPAFFLGGVTEYTRSLKYSRFTLPVTVINPLSESS